MFKLGSEVAKKFPGLVREIGEDRIERINSVTQIPYACAIQEDMEKLNRARAEQKVTLLRDETTGRECEILVKTNRQDVDITYFC